MSTRDTRPTTPPVGSFSPRGSRQTDEDGDFEPNDLPPDPARRNRRPGNRAGPRHLLATVESGNSIPILDRDCFTRWRPAATEVTLVAGETTKVELKVIK